ncbi:MAG TPA: hypothetical protein VL404_05740 [Candidatus Eisenbacteria bacterium]|nr:hypothetical protein [Candidatus Eisenbacteria bacterium]
MIAIPGLGWLFRIFTRDELMEESFWILRLVSSMAAAGGVVQVLVAGFTPPALAYLGLAAILLGVSFIRLYWVRFGAMAGWTAVVAFDLATRRNPFGCFFLAIGLYFIYKMLKYSQMYEGRTVMK